MGECHSRVNFHSPRDAVNAFCKLQGRQSYEDYCELVLYFASEFICSSRPYIRSYKLDYEPLIAPMVPWQHPAEDHSVSSLRSPRKQLISYLEETNLTCLETYEAELSLRKSKRKLFSMSLQENISQE